MGQKLGISVVPWRLYKQPLGQGNRRADESTVEFLQDKLFVTRHMAIDSLVCPPTYHTARDHDPVLLILFAFGYGSIYYGIVPHHMVYSYRN